MIRLLSKALGIRHLKGQEMVLGREASHEPLRRT
jgi:hypothetical protein